MRFDGSDHDIIQDGMAAFISVHLVQRKRAGAVQQPAENIAVRIRFAEVGSRNMGRMQPFLKKLVLRPAGVPQESRSAMGQVAGDCAPEEIL